MRCCEKFVYIFRILGRAAMTRSTARLWLISFGQGVRTRLAE